MPQELGEVYNRIQAQYGEKPTKPREAKKTLGKDDFLKIMLTQMKNQDPTNPFKAEQMAAEIAQFTSVEQLQNVNHNLNKMSGQNRPIEQMAMTNLIGKVVRIDRGRFPHLDGENDSLSFQLPRDATKVKVAILNEAGEEVFHKDLGAQKAGEVTFGWDGIRSNTLAAKAGNYIFRPEAKDKNDKAIDISPLAQARIIGVSFEGTEPVFLVGDASHQEKITMRNISRIELDTNSLESGKGIQPIAVNQSKTPNIIPLPKDFGPQGNGPAKQEIAKTLEKYQQSIQPPVAPATPPLIAPEGFPEEKGFPNGLHDVEPSKSPSLKGSN